MEMSFNWLKSIEQIVNDVGINQRLQQFGAETCYKYMFDFVPFDTGALSQTVDIEANKDFGTVNFKQPYAHYQYVGDFNFQKTHHPLATNYWDKAMMTMYSGRVANEIDNYRKRLSK